jgi:hypothetical protein
MHHTQSQRQQIQRTAGCRMVHLLSSIAFCTYAMSRATASDNHAANHTNQLPQHSPHLASTTTFQLLAVLNEVL